MKKVFPVLIAAVGLLVVAACDNKSRTPDGSEATAAEKEMKVIIDNYLDDVVYDIYGNLANGTGRLYEQLTALKASAKEGKLSQEKIDEACATFLDARHFWEVSEAFLYGSASDHGIDPHIDTWPLEKSTLCQQLAKAEDIKTLDEDEDASIIGEKNLGFHAIEFILFRGGKNRSVAAFEADDDDPDFGSAKVSGTNELIYAAAVAKDLRNYTWWLECDWDADAPGEHLAVVEDEMEKPIGLRNGNTYGVDMSRAGEKGSTYTTLQEVFVDIIGDAGCGNIANEVANTKMAKAYTGDDPNYIESPYSKKSYQDFRDNILSCQYSLYGAYGAAAPKDHSVMTFMRGNGGKAEAEKLEKTLKAALSALDVCCAEDHKAFVDEPKSADAKAAIDKINEFNDALGEAADWFAKF
ncbi:MAG: imelysin [Bacteroidales bacterium]|nr:imelysin [Bacteroidales bacterium]